MKSQIEFPTNKTIKSKHLKEMIKENSLWQAKNGQLIHILTYTPHTINPWLGNVLSGKINQSWGEIGNYTLDGAAHSLDLMREVPWKNLFALSPNRCAP